MADQTAASLYSDPDVHSVPATSSCVLVVEGLPVPVPNGNGQSADGNGASANNGAGPNGRGASGPSSAARVLAVPDGPSVFLCGEDRDGPALVALGALPDTASLTGGTPSDIFADEALVLFEPVRTASGEKLLMITPPGSTVRLNGLAPPLVTPLAVGDQVDLGRSSVLHVSRYRRSAPIPAPDDLVGQPCSLCLGEFTRESRLVRCDNCGTGRHMEKSADAREVSEEDRLECAALGPCPPCGSELPVSKGSDGNSNGTDGNSNGAGSNGGDDALVFWPEGVTR